MNFMKIEENFNRTLQQKYGETVRRYVNWAGGNVLVDWIKIHNKSKIYYFKVECLDKCY